jgi:hypothetical protein
VRRRAKQNFCYPQRRWTAAAKEWIRLNAHPLHKGEELAKHMLKGIIVSVGNNGFVRFAISVFFTA